MLFTECDVRDVPALQSAIARSAERLGPIRVLVNNAANDQRHQVAETDVELWDDRMAVNLRHHFFAAQAVAPMMREAGGGSIINLGSISVHIDLMDLPGYIAAKAGIEGLTRTLAREYGPWQIRVNCIIPGWIMTERQLRDWVTPEASRVDRPQPVPAGQAVSRRRRADVALARGRGLAGLHGSAVDRRRRLDVNTRAEQFTAPCTHHGEGPFWDSGRRPAAAGRHARRSRRVGRFGRRYRTPDDLDGGRGAAGPDRRGLRAGHRARVHPAPVGPDRGAGAAVGVRRPADPDERRRLRSAGPVLLRHDGLRRDARGRDALPARSGRDGRRHAAPM